MHDAPTVTLALQAEPMRLPASFMAAVLVLLVGGAAGWLVAAVLGFSRARAFGPSARWFAMSALCLLLYHLQWFLWVVFGVYEKEVERLLSVGAFFNLFVALGSVCAIIGFVQLGRE
jgi:hypothetical protein